MEKVFFCGNIVRNCATNEIVGKLHSASNSRIEVILNNGCHQYAIYGSLDKDGGFLPFCYIYTACGESCFGRKEGENFLCRYDKDIGQYMSNAGYYVDTQATKDVH